MSNLYGKYLFLIIFFHVLLLNQPLLAQNESLYNTEFKLYELNEVNYSILLPEFTKIEIYIYENYVIYHFFQIGLFFGNTSSLLREELWDEYDVKITTMESIFLNNNIYWDVYCQVSDTDTGIIVNYFTESIIEIKENSGLDKLIHIWIFNETLQGIHDSLTLFSTLKKIDQ
jgi:hypothetical protein